ncbi:hypothetical protein NITHO_2690016 [Nitrolancea hollandica Lb]|uniref:Uncharacterized protein n=1 Tax=Nitrolancea hollandica Lb TaxID=1129897 RepID=I4EGD5_9BACT|nr:hypothetical protein NITHO_2690016 [Nitrolancea hollandica Lb]
MIGRNRMTGLIQNFKLPHHILIRYFEERLNRGVAEEASGGFVRVRQVPIAIEDGDPIGDVIEDAFNLSRPHLGFVKPSPGFGARPSTRHVFELLRLRLPWKYRRLFHDCPGLFLEGRPLVGLVVSTPGGYHSTVFPGEHVELFAPSEPRATGPLPEPRHPVHGKRHPWQLSCHSRATG